MSLSILFMLVVAIYRAIKRKLRSRVPLDFEGKTMWITGGSSGIGEHLVYKLNSLGGKMIISSRNKSELQRVKNNCKNPENIQIVQLDQSNPELVYEQVTQYISQNKWNIDILINNAGVSMRALALENSFNNDKYIMNLNYLGQVAITKAILPQMHQRGVGGQIVIISSIAGKLGVPYRSTYCASKHALAGYFDSLRAEVQDQGIHITQVFPGYVKTNSAKNALVAGDGQKLGNDEDNILNGMEPSEFAQITCEAIYFKEREVIVGTLLQQFAVFCRNVMPAIVFTFMAKIYKFNQAQQIEQSLNSTQKKIQ